MKLHDTVPVKIIGHLLIEDDLGNVLVDTYNAVHPENMARVFSRALSNEANYFVKRIAYGNGGTTVDAALNVTFNAANDGQAPDTKTWDSTLYNETYTEIVDDSDPLIGQATEPGAAVGDPPSVEHVSGPGVVSTELGILSQAQIISFLNPDEPTGQILSSTDPDNQNLDGTFTFDEIGLFTDGLSQVPTAGIHDLEVGVPATVNSETSTELSEIEYEFEITVDTAGTPTAIFFTPPFANPTYGDLAEAINTGDVTWNAIWGSVNPLPGGATVSITDVSGNFPSLIGAQTFGFLQFTSGTTGVDSSVLIENRNTNVVPQAGSVDLFNNATGLNNPTGVDPAGIAPVNGEAAGVQNDAVNPNTEAERLLTHVIFSPIQKTADRTLQITYTLTIAVARSQ